MITKSGLKDALNKIVDESIQSSDYIKKLTDCVTMIAVEAKRIADLMVLINNRLNDHEVAILQLLETQKRKKDSLDTDLPKSAKLGSTKPN